MLIRGFLCAALSVLVSGPVMAQQLAPADNTRPRDPVALQPGATAGNGQAEEIRQLKAAVVHLQEQVNQLSSKPDPSNSQGRLTPPINPLPLFDPLSRDDPAPGQAASNQAKSEGEPAWRMHADWRDGLQIAAADEAFRVHVGGRLQFDSGWNAAGQAVQFGPGGIGELQDGADSHRRHDVRALRVGGGI